MTQNDFNFLQEACVGKLNALLQEIVENDKKVKEMTEKPVESKKNEKKQKESK